MSNLSGKRGRLPLFLIFIAFYIPLLSIFQHLFQENGWQGIMGEFSSLFHSRAFLKTLIFTIVQAALSALFSLILALPGAALFSRYHFPFKKTILSLSFISFILPPILVVLAFVQFWGQQGWVNQLWMSLFPQSSGVNVLYSGRAIVLAHVFFNLPLALRLVYDTWSSIPHSQEEAAHLLGASPIRTFFRVTLPQLFPSMGSALLLIFLYCFLSFSIVLVLGGGPQFSTLEVEVYQQIKFSHNYLRGGTIALLEICFTLLLMFLYLHLDGRQHKMKTHQIRNGQMKAMGTQGRILLGIYLLLYLLFLGAPLMALISKSFILQRGWSGPGEFTLRWYGQLFQKSSSALSFKAIWTSVKYATGTTVLVTLITMTMGHQILRRKLLFPRLTQILILMPLGISSVLLALSFLRMSISLPRDSILKGLMIILIHSFISLPLAYRSLQERIRQLPQNLMDAAKNLGAKPMALFRHIELPLLKPALLTSGLFAFALSIGEVNAVLILSQPGDVTIPLAIFRLIGNYKFNGASAMGTLLIAITLGAFILMEKLNNAD